VEYSRAGAYRKLSQALKELVDLAGDPVPPPHNQSTDTVDVLPAASVS